MDLKYRGDFFSDMTEAVHLNDDEIQDMIDEVFETLSENDTECDCINISSGDTLVLGTKTEGKEINISVTQNYKKVTLIDIGDGNWKPIDWAELNRARVRRKEILNEISRLENELRELNECQ